MMFVVVPDSSQLLILIYLGQSTMKHHYNGFCITKSIVNELINWEIGALPNKRGSFDGKYFHISAQGT